MERSSKQLRSALPERVFAFIYKIAKITPVMVAGIALAACQTTATQVREDSQRLEFVSYNPEGYDAIIGGNYQVKPATISGDLYLPAGDEKAPVVVLMHGSGGVYGLLPLYRDIIQALDARGIGAFVVDSYSGRGIGETASQQSRLSIPGNVIDGFQALKLLAGHPRVDADRIGISGTSRGGIVAFQTAHAGFAEKVGEGLSFAGHLPVYPSCQLRFEDARFTDAPILMLLGEKDDYTPAHFCVDYAKELAANQVEIETKVYPNAHHGFDGKRAPGTCSTCAVFADCGLAIVERDGNETALDGKVSTRNGWKNFVSTLYKACGRRGATVGLNSEARTDRIKTTADFFAKALRPRKAGS